MTRGRERRLFLLAAALGATLSCGGKATGPVAGNIVVSLQTPNSGSDGAILVLLAGPAAPTSLSAGPGLTLWQLPINGQTTNSVALTGTLVNGPILIIGVEDVNKVGDYGVVIQDVAANGTYALRNKSSYSVTVTKQ